MSVQSSEPVVASVIIPARDEETALGGCLQALRRQTVGAERLHVVVVVAGTDHTGTVAAREGADHFGRFEIVRLEAGNKNVALQAGCSRALAEVIVLLDADTEVQPDAIAVLLFVLAQQPGCVAHGAATPRIDTWISRYWELNRTLVKDLDFDGNLSGELVALPRAALPPADLSGLLPAEVSAEDDLHLGRRLQQRGWRIVYAPAARATTLVPWTVRGLMTTMLRSRRGLMRLLPFPDAAMQAAKSALLVGAVPAAVLVWHWSSALAALCIAPLIVHGIGCIRQVERARRIGLGDFRRELAAFIVLDLIGRGLKLWAFVERVAGRTQPVAFRGERPMGEHVVSANNS